MDFEIGLYAHNAEAYEKVKKNLKENDRTCIVHATGTGKSFIALQLMYDFIKANPNKKIVYLTPLTGIKGQVMEHITNIEERNREKGIEFHKEYFDNVEFINYQALMTKSAEELKSLDVDLLVTDEFHHIGAPEWTRAINTLIESHPGMKIFGMSATSVRERGTSHETNVADTFFEGNVASEYPLETAIADGVLPAPNYHAALVFLEDECTELEEKVKEGKASSEEKEEYTKILKNIKNKIASLGENSVQDLIKEYIKPDGKYIYFCPKGVNIEELQNNFLEMLEPSIRENTEFYTVHSSQYTSKENETVSDNFYNNRDKNGENVKGRLRVMFAIDMYNEGIHVPDIDGVIMGRSTGSDIIFYQQLGRALAVKKKSDNDEDVIEGPLVIDLQDNFRKILKLYREVEHTQKERINDTKKGQLLKEGRQLFYTFGLDDEIINIVEELDKIKAKTSFTLSFEEKLQEFLEYIRENDIPSQKNKTAKFSDDKPMGDWWQRNKQNIYAMQEENPLAKEIVRIVAEKDPFNRKMKEFLEHIRENDIPNSETKQPTFSDDMPMGSWWRRHKQKIYAMQEENPLAKEIVEIVESKRSLTFEEKLQKFLEHIRENDIPTTRNTTAKFSDNVYMGLWWSRYNQKIYAMQEENPLAKEIVRIVTEKDPFNRKMKEFLEYIRENDIPTQSNKTAKFSDDMPMGSWWSRYKQKIYDMQEENPLAKEIVTIFESKRSLTFEEKLQKFLEHIRENDIPTRGNKTAKFSDGVPMGRWWLINQQKIYDMQEENPLAKEIVRIVTEKDPFNRKMKEFLEYIRENDIPNLNAKQPTFSDDLPMGPWWRRHKQKIYDMQEENPLAKEIVTIAESKRKLTFEEKLHEFLEYIRENDIPKTKAEEPTFSNGKPMGPWWAANKKKIYLMQEENPLAKEIVEIVESKKKIVKETKKEVPNEKALAEATQKIVGGKPKKKVKTDGKQL